MTSLSPKKLFSTLIGAPHCDNYERPVMLNKLLKQRYVSATKIPMKVKIDDINLRGFFKGNLISQA